MENLASGPPEPRPPVAIQSATDVHPTGPEIAVDNEPLPEFRNRWDVWSIPATLAVLSKRA